MCAVLVPACTQHALVLPSLPQRIIAISSWLFVNIYRQGKVTFHSQDGWGHLAGYTSVVGACIQQ